MIDFVFNVMAIICEEILIYLRKTGTRIVFELIDLKLNRLLFPPDANTVFLTLLQLMGDN